MTVSSANFHKHSPIWSSQFHHLNTAIISEPGSGSFPTQLSYAFHWTLFSLFLPLASILTVIIRSSGVQRKGWQLRSEMYILWTFPSVTLMTISIFQRFDKFHEEVILLALLSSFERFCHVPQLRAFAFSSGGVETLLKPPAWGTALASAVSLHSKQPLYHTPRLLEWIICFLPGLWYTRVLRHHTSSIKTVEDKSIITKEKGKWY